MKLVKEPIKLPTTYTVPAASIKARDRLLDVSSQFTEVTCVNSQANVAALARNLRTLTKDAKAVCAPILKAIKAAGDAVRKLQNDYIAPVEAEQERCERMLVDFHKREEDRAKAEAAATQAEIERLKALQRVVEQIPTQTAPDSPEALQAEMEAHDMQQHMEALILAPPPEPAKPKGVAMKQRMRVEVIDVHALYAARPDLVRLEANLSAIQEYCHPDLPPVPGLKLWFETTAETRAA